MVDDGTQVLEAPRRDGPAPTIGDPGGPVPARRQEFETCRLVASMRHGRGLLARIATTLNNHGVRQLTYTSTEFGTATVEVEVLARDAARVEARLRRMVEVVEVAPA
ncbi:hypothetical protein [Embleya sp. NBC_00896]|uniref:hypothetical protein n=1 Tax=Embleya sp. NBC_00896 TaxID=2975961 RepID=UPI0038653630|nr:hypothetical protein OG928_28820 [Embleya sp. NBC_00896]